MNVFSKMPPMYTVELPSTFVRFTIAPLASYAYEMLPPVTSRRVMRFSASYQPVPSVDLQFPSAFSASLTSY